MIMLNNSSVADVKYGSQQVDKVYYGSDLVWERDPWVTFSFPTASIGMTGNNSYGFSASGAPVYQSDEDYTHYKSFDLTTWYCFVVTVYTTLPRLILTFPSEFGGEAIVTSVNVAPAGGYSGLSYAENGKIYLITSGHTPSDSSAWVEYSGFSPKDGNGTATYFPVPEVVDLPCTGIAFTSQSETAVKYGNIVINFKLPKSKYNAWAKKYGVS